MSRPRSLDPHELRHSAASIMLAQGTPLWVVSEVLGHASIAITKDTYGHLLGAEKQEATEAITDALFEPGRGGDREGGPRVDLDSGSSRQGERG